MDEDELAHSAGRVVLGEPDEWGLETGDLRDVIGKLKRTLVLVSPRHGFGDDVRRRLLSWTPESQGGTAGGLGAHSREIVVGAVVLSLAGAALLYWRSRMPVALGTEQAHSEVEVVRA